MIAGSTIPITFTFPDSDYDFNLASEIVITITYKNIEQDYTPTVIDATTLQVTMTQAQSLALAVAPYDILAEAQLNMLYNGVRVASEVKKFNVSKQLNKEVIS